MKILHIIDSLEMGGAENVLVGLSAGQKIKGHDVVVMPLVCSKHTLVRDKIEANGIEVRPFAENGSVYHIKFVWKIAKVLRYYDIVHVHLFPALYWAGIAKMLSFCRTPLVYTEHSTSNRRRNNRCLHVIDRIIYQHAYKRVVACAEKVMETYKASFPMIHHVCAINNGVDTHIYQYAVPYSKQELLGVEEDCFIVTMVARFMTMKRQDTIVGALAKLPEDIHAVFVGGNAQDEGLLRVMKLAACLQVEKRVHFLYIRKDVPRILKTSDVVIMASDYEGLSLSSIEGMAAGKPFVASDVNGLREVVEGAGLLFENKNSDALAKIINMLYEDKESFSKIGKQCLQRSKEFDVSIMTDNYLQVYKDLLS